MTKFWVVHYQTNARGRGGEVYLEAESLRDACLAFDRFFKDRQTTDAWAKERVEGFEPYWGTLLCVKVYGWAPHSVDADGRLLPSTTDMAGDGGFEWKIDSPGLPYLEWVEAKTKEPRA